jgi:hypothetical protein
MVNQTLKQTVWIVVFSAAVSGALRSAQADLLAHYTFDDGTAADVTGNGNNGTLEGTAQIVDSERGQVLSLDGMGKVDLGNPAGLDFSGEMTIAAWLNIAADVGLSANANVVNRGHGGTPNREFTFRVGTSGAEYDFGSWETNRGDNHATLPLPPEDLGVGNWVHIAGTADFDESTSMYTWNLYRDAELVNTSVPYPDGLLPMMVGWAIGARGGVAAVERGFRGLIDDVRIYDDALSQAAIEETMMGGQMFEPGDFNSDGMINEQDFLILSNNLAAHLDGGPIGRAQGDMNFDGRVDLDDFGAFKANYPGAFSQANAIPEPASIALALWGLAMTFALTTRRGFFRLTAA